MHNLYMPFCTWGYFQNYTMSHSPLLLLLLFISFLCFSLDLHHCRKLLIGIFVLLPLTSVWFSHSVVPDSLQPHGLQHSRPPCPSPTPRLYSNSCPLSQWCRPTISSSVIPSNGLSCENRASSVWKVSQNFVKKMYLVGMSDYQFCFIKSHTAGSL